jgi:hypothetical protein
MIDFTNKRQRSGQSARPATKKTRARNPTNHFILFFKEYNIIYFFKNEFFVSHDVSKLSFL